MNNIIKWIAFIPASQIGAPLDDLSKTVEVKLSKIATNMNDFWNSVAR